MSESMSGGARGLEALARTEGAAHPRAFVDWCAALAEEGDHRGVIAAAEVGLESLPEHASMRAEVADYWMPRPPLWARRSSSGSLAGRRSWPSPRSRGCSRCGTLRRNPPRGPG